jgi:hypothetical protein
MRKEIRKYHNQIHNEGSPRVAGLLQVLRSTIAPFVPSPVE